MTTTPSYGAQASQIITAIVFLWISWRLWKFFKYPPRPSFRQRSVAILVLGDIGRSPRMMYHAESFARNQFETYFVGYGGSEPIPSLKRLPHVHFISLAEPPSYLKMLPFILLAPIKIAQQIATILIALLFEISHPPEFILVQNPPSIPTLALVWLVGRIRGSKVIIDWHNLGYSILAMRLGKDHIFVKVAKWFEATFGQTAYAHLFVTQAMCDYLVKEWDLKGHKAVLHDRPPQHFHRTSPQDTHNLFRDLAPVFAQPPLSSFLPSSSPPYSTPFTTTVSPSSTSISSPASSHGALTSPTPMTLATDPASGTYSKINMPTLRTDRPALVVSSTSWTPDEDFSILIEALGQYEKRARARAVEARQSIGTSNGHMKAEEEGWVGGQEEGWVGGLPRILVVLTGKGPLKEKYMEEVGKLQSGEDGWKWVKCISLWLEAKDYPLLLGSADLGVCLHSSSSALDLPMKVVDMFGCGLPVCALHFACLDELVKDGINGLVFKNAAQLAEQFERLLTSFPTSPSLDTLRFSLLKSSNPPPGTPQARNGSAEGEGTHWEWGTWEDNWAKVVRPLILSDVAKEAAY